MRDRRPAVPFRPPGPWPWLDRFGRFSPLRLSLLVALAAPGAVLLALLATGGMGAEPWKAATREAGSHAAHILLISLAVTPLRFIADWPKAATLRRMVGLAALAYALLHLVLYAGHLAWDLLAVALEIATRLYLTLGFAVLAGLAVLGWTSTDGWQARLGRRWGRLHRWVYLLAAGAVLHAFLQSRARADAAVLLAGCYLWLMLWRLLPGRRRAHPPALLGLAAVAALGAALVEFAWYAATTSLPAGRILAANLGTAAGLRPAQAVLLAALAAALLPLLRRRWVRR
ncbi:sulfite oxidase heme-binding subunit YedZ [Falsiroseomonas sp.]|uniref:sulfite oxidase heme-binding subunit YedZ n=1 Tax=Falsiroseomonas sp. TaxID=2870721 RepID=UPI0035682F49